MKKLILLLLFIPLVSFGQTYKVESKKNYDNTTTVKVTKQSDAYENPQIIQPKTDVYAFPVYNPPNMSGFLDAYQQEWRNMRQRRYQKYRFNPNKQTTLKLYRANKKIGYPLDAGIRRIDIEKYVLKKK